MIDLIVTKEISNRLGIGYKYLTIYKRELIHLKNDGLTHKEIAKLLNVNFTTVCNWYDKNSQPKQEIIYKLEIMFFTRFPLV